MQTALFKCKFEPEEIKKLKVRGDNCCIKTHNKTVSLDENPRLDFWCPILQFYGVKVSKNAHAIKLHSVQQWWLGS